MEQSRRLFLKSTATRYLTSAFHLDHAGQHVLRVSMVDPGLVVQKIIVSGARLPDSDFGPPDNRPVS
ncbi:hypothetical protein [Asticcacaulis benevestitus]|uniref:Gylcosyl hydrolase 115 C-terminal domain-containing protein n=1 Tax=Asticcacaulis benevestitus DSM 16100 = ATCC BAA-896 TaxID=1121022 RepID=V4PFW3_9CAUL|nr:hypothetical protein [Asticcacaulis benevestitus]ESQ92877.1 hypothetical protein ABENE_07170 [Asticcacaulis benevestitus DSM 16100 = ATCC BAA-896]